MSGRRLNLTPLVLVAMILVMDMGVGVSASTAIQAEDLTGQERPENWPPALMCGEVICDPIDRTVRSPPFDAGFPVEDEGWWFGYWYDLDSNGMDDRLQRIIAGQRTSVSTTSITGPDGLPTVAIVVDYSWHPGSDDIDAIKQVLYDHGWQEEGSWFDPLGILDSIVIDHVPVS